MILQRGQKGLQPRYQHVCDSFVATSTESRWAGARWCHVVLQLLCWGVLDRAEIPALAAPPVTDLWFVFYSQR